MYNLLEYSKNYRKTSGSVWNYYRDKPSNPLCSNSESFKYKTSIQGDTCNVGVGEAGYDANKVGKNKTEVVIPLINCEVEFILTWSKNCVLVNMTEDALVDPAIVAPTELKFEITHKIVCSCCYLSKQNDTKLLEQLKAGFKKTLKWNKYRSQMTIQPKNNNLK